MGNWGHREAKESPFKEGSVPGAQGVCQHRETGFFFPGDTARLPTAAGSDP